MIGPGWLPSRPIHRFKKRTLAYVRPRRKRASRSAKPRQQTGPVEDQSTVIFYNGPAEFPTAMLVPNDSRSKLSAGMMGFGKWLLGGWSWFRPRTVPVVVAALGLLAVLESADYLRHVKTAPPNYTQK